MLTYDLAKADSYIVSWASALGIIHPALSARPAPKPRPFPIYYQAAALQR